MARFASLAVPLFLLMSSASSCGGTVQRIDGGEGLLPAGARAPEVVGVDPSGKTVKLSESRGRPAVVYFYPRDGTPGCTTQACGFRDAWSRYQALGVTIFGVSSDSPERHREFQAEHHLPFPLASDEDGVVARGYGVPKQIWGYSRVTFLIDREGVVARVWPSVDPGVHADDVLRAVASLPTR